MVTLLVVHLHPMDRNKHSHHFPLFRHVLKNTHTDKYTALFRDVLK